MKAKNLKEFKALKKRYESITLEEIKEIDDSGCFFGDNIANKLTGFGKSETCTLCEKINCWDSCDKCIYYILTKGTCNNGIAYETYYGIENAYNPTTLRNAFRARAKHMQTLLKLIK